MDFSRKGITEISIKFPILVNLKFRKVHRQVFTWYEKMVFHERKKKLAFRKEEKKIQKTTYFVQSAYISLFHFYLSHMKKHHMCICRDPLRGGARKGKIH
jgi:hypothetical protein